MINITLETLGNRSLTLVECQLAKQPHSREDIFVGELHKDSVEWCIQGAAEGVAQVSLCVCSLAIPLTLF